MQCMPKRCDCKIHLTKGHFSNSNRNKRLQIKANHLPTSAHFADTLFLNNCLLRFFRPSRPGLFNESGVSSSSIVTCGLPIINDSLIIDRADILSRAGDGMVDHIMFAHILRRLDVSLR